MARFNPTFTEEELQNETWKPIPGFEEYYEISNLGRARNIKAEMRRRVGHFLAPQLIPNGYIQIRLNMNGKTLYFYAHRLVMLAFVGPCPNGYVTNHKDFDRTNNRPENLEYMSQPDNLAYSRNQGRMKLPTRQKGDDHWARRHPEKMANRAKNKNPFNRERYINSWLAKRKLSDAQIIEIKAMLAEGAMLKIIAARFNVSMSLISMIKNGKKHQSSKTAS